MNGLGTLDPPHIIGRSIPPPHHTPQGQILRGGGGGSIRLIKNFKKEKKGIFFLE